MAARPRSTEGRKSLRLACWNAYGVRGRKLELEHFLSQHGVDICLLSETLLKPEQTFRLANYVCHCIDRRTLGGGTAILVCRGIVHHSVPVPGLTHLEATAIQVTFAEIAGHGGWRSQRQTRGLELLTFDILIFSH